MIPRTLFAAALILFASAKISFADAPTFEAWQQKLDIHPAAGSEARHTIHSYYLTCPESPDGKHVLFYASTTPEGHTGEIRIRDRTTGTERVVAAKVTTEDAHRAACQQWSCGGRRVVYHDVRAGRWMVVAVDVASGSERILAHDRQVAFGQPTSDWVPIYGCHWAPGEHRDLELVNAETGEIRKVLSVAEVEAKYGDWTAREFGKKPLSIFFPITSPSGERVFFKLAAGQGGDFRSSAASHRAGLFVYDISAKKFLFQTKWGHPAWRADSQAVLEMHNQVIDLATGKQSTILGLPDFRGCHPSYSPDGTLFVCDAVLEGTKLRSDIPAGKPGEWGVFVGDIRGGRYQLIHRFDNSAGAKSWRHNHPHPIFTADGRRIYFNTNSGPYTQLWVAEVR